VLALASGCGGSNDTPSASRPREAVVPHTRFEGVEYLGRTTISGRATDLSPVASALEDGTPSNRLGAFGSAIAWTGADERYLAASDRGPADGGTSYRCRWHEVEIRVRPGTETPVSFELRATVLLTDADGRPFVGSSAALSPSASNAGRLDPEGLSLARDGSVWISDEYGPSLLEFDRTGRLLRRIEPPLAFRVERPQGDARDELQLNARGRTPNRGFEGLAIVGDGAELACLTQGPLIQDGAAKGLVCRLLELTLADGSTRQRAVPLDAMRGSFNDLVAYAPQRFLTLERDAESGELRRIRRVVALDLSAAEDISDRERVTSVDAVKCARKTLVCDLLDARWGLDLATLPDKLEALCLGPDLADGRRLLLVVSDNDLVADEASVVWAFAIDRERLER
jgi:hypothetical protein